MLATRPVDSETSRWAYNRFDPLRKQPGHRMSSGYDHSLSTQQDWQGQYSYLPPDDTAVFSQSFGPQNDSTPSSRSPRTVEPAAATIDAALKGEEGASTDDGKEQKLPSPAPKAPSSVQLGAVESSYTVKRADAGIEGPTATADTPALSMGSTHLSSVSSAGQASEAPVHATQASEKLDATTEHDEELDDDDEEMLDLEGDQLARPMTAAERTAARRKMKRFRLTHQQTRFLMSEFAKQPHPDAAHRERLSKEIPGLSPRQVQVWFQNRRAKIKRLTADDRNQMIKMRAVPDDFDNVQALHSPYGAVQGLTTPMGPPVEFGTPNYGGDGMLRPLMVDVRRGDHDEHLSPTGLTPSFGGIGFQQGGGMHGSELMSPVTPSSGGRYPFTSHLSSPLSAGPRMPGSLGDRPSGIDNSLHMNRQGIRPLQPLHLRDPLNRSRSDTIHSPLRTSMSWKGDSMSYSTYPTPSSADLSGRPPSIYENQQMNSSPQAGQHNFDSTNPYTNHSGTYDHHQSSMAYPMGQAHSRSSRLRASSATIPPTLDFKDQHRSVDVAPHSATAGSRPRPPSTTSQLDSPSIYTTSYPPAPLTAPIDFSLSKSAASRSSASRPDYSAAQMSAPINAPSDFSNAFQGGMSAPATRTPMRDSFSGSAYANNQEETSSSYDGRGLNAHRKTSFTAAGGHGLDRSDSQS